MSIECAITAPSPRSAPSSCAP